MKLISWNCSSLEVRQKSKGFFLTPLLSVRSLHRTHRRKNYSARTHLLIFGLLLFLSWALAYALLSPLNYWETLLISPIIYFMTETAAALANLLLGFSSQQSFAIHQKPILAPTLAQFWGRRWNIWVQDWLKDIRSRVYKNSRPGRIFVTFTVSGLFHEVMVNFPYWLVFGKSYFGTMMLYFAIQSLALWLDKHLLPASPPLLRRGFMWCALVLPSPLFINVPLLTFLGLKHD